MRYRNQVKVVLFTISTCLLMGCGNHDQFKDLREYIRKINEEQSTKKRSVQLAMIHMPKVTTYQAEKLRSPFSGTALTVNKTPATFSNPLQAYPLSMLRFVGTVIEDDNVLAYIMSPDNMVYEIKVGDTVGDHNGKVESISPNQLSIIEQEIVYGKPPSQHVVTMQLKDEY